MPKLFTAKAARRNYENYNVNIIYNAIIEELNRIIQEKSKNNPYTVINLSTFPFNEMVMNTSLQNRVHNALNSVGYKIALTASISTDPMVPIDGYMKIEW